MGGTIFREVTAVIRLVRTLAIRELQVSLALISLFDEFANLLGAHELQNLNRILSVEQEGADGER